MNVVQPVKEFVRMKIDELTDAGAKKFYDSVRPLYGIAGSNSPNHIGTCILLSINQKKYLLTAAHVADHREDTALHVGVNNQLVEIDGNLTSTSKPSGGRDNDHYDFAWLELSPRFLKQAGHLEFITEEFISTGNVGTKNRLFLALGYPNSKNKKINHAKKTVVPRPLKYASTIKDKPRLCKKLGISGAEHLFLDFSSKYSKASDGQMVRSISPKGVSGGALVDMGKIPIHDQRNALTKGLLAGLLIENHAEHQVMCAVKIGFIVDQIKRESQL